MTPNPFTLPPATPYDEIERRVIDAIWGVETDYGTNLAVGDGGKAHGHLQQHEAHWRRGCEYLRVDWPWPQDAYDRDKAVAVAIANWRRDAWPQIERMIAEQLALRFRLPNAPMRKDNDAYWTKVSRELREQKQESKR